MTSSRVNDDGFLSAEWLMGITFLVLPCFIIVLSIVQVPARKNLTQVASVAAARAYVQALDQSQADAAARAAAAEAIAGEVGGDASNADSFLSSHKVNVSISSGTYCPGSEFTVTVSMPYPLVLNPYSKSGSLSVGPDASSKATDRIDDYTDVVGEDFDNDLCDAAEDGAP